MSYPIGLSTLLRPLLAAAASLLLAAGAAPAQLPLVGLSAVRGQAFDNEDLFFFVPEVGDHFGWALAAGDFNGDGAEDLATGIPFDEGLVGSACGNCGIVVVRYGAPGSGLLGGLADTVLYQGLAGSPDPPEASDRFGAALAAGDFNGDGFDDLAVGVPGDHAFSNGIAVGAVQVHYGTAGGLELGNPEYLDEGLAWTEVEPFICIGDEFGAALAVGNFDGDAFDDLAIGAPMACIGSNPFVDDAGEVFVAHGSSAGLLPLAGYGISENSAGIFGDAANGERFGGALAAGDFDADGHDDLAIGVPHEGDNGSLYVIMGSPFGLIYVNSVFWAPGALGLEPEEGDRLGFALAAADFDGDGHDDLAIGDPNEDLGAANEIADAGSISIAYGSPAWFDLSRTDNFTQEILYSDPLANQSGDQFGWALAAGDFDGDGRADLVAGHPGEEVEGLVNAGATTILMGAPDAGLGARVGSLAAGVDGAPGSGQAHADFGRALASGDFDGNGFADLAVGAPYLNAGGIEDTGGETVLYGSLFADGFEVGSPLRWSSAVP
ncbi:MAG: hypothetical protein F9K18_06040 [Thermoanaerobaculia bacterium]|nr:MAG: hypothetical protein F9K18_06040 [Thermoanaerobaculia bacterium]